MRSPRFLRRYLGSKILAGTLTGIMVFASLPSANLNAAGIYAVFPPQVACSPAPGVVVPAGTPIEDLNQVRYMIGTQQIIFEFFWAGKAHPTIRYINVANRSTCHITADFYAQYYKIFYPVGHPLRYAGQELVYQDGHDGLPAGAGLQFAYNGPGCAMQFDLALGAPNAHIAGFEEGHPSNGTTHIPICQKPAPPPPPPASSAASSVSSVNTSVDLSVVKTGPATAQPGQNISYNLKTRTDGPGTQYDAIITDHIPAGLQFVSTSNAQKCAHQNDKVVCTYLGNNFPAGSEGTIQVTLKVPANAACGTTYSNTATISGGTSTTDPNAANNTSTWTTTIPCPSSSSSSSSSQSYQCSDGADNDGDGATDHPNDFSCSGPTDNDETHPMADCQDGTDNDGDGKIDYPQDPGCTSKQDDNEVNASSASSYSSVSSYSSYSSYSSFSSSSAQSYECSDGQDNDHDGAIDGNDYSCTGATDDDETLPKADCQDGQDNDGDGYTDYPADPGCHSKQDDNEYNPMSSSSYSSVSAQCNDGQDNDYDGAADYPYDFSCADPSDNDEKWPKAQCQDGNDNDGDGKIDYPNDPGCYSKQDNDEHNATSSHSSYSSYSSYSSSSSAMSYPSSAYSSHYSSAMSYPSSKSSSSHAAHVPQCRDGKDNDGDGKKDLQDPGCSGPDDNSEWNWTWNWKKWLPWVNQNANVNTNATTNVNSEINAFSGNETIIKQNGGGTQNATVDTDSQTTVNSQINANAVNNTTINQNN